MGFESPQLHFSDTCTTAPTPPKRQYRVVGLNALLELALRALEVASCGPERFGGVGLVPSDPIPEIVIDALECFGRSGCGARRCRGTLKVVLQSLSVVTDS
jgi:hypothetical protein